VITGVSDVTVIVVVVAVAKGAVCTPLPADGAAGTPTGGGGASMRAVYDGDHAHMHITSHTHVVLHSNYCARAKSSLHVRASSAELTRSPQHQEVVHPLTCCASP
jgi:hypothetical protein